MILRQHFIYLEHRAFVFAYVPKVACTNWKALLRHVSGFSDYLDSSLAHDRLRNGLVYLSDVDRWEEILADPVVARYSFVRNPYSRVLSAYLNKIEPLALGEGEWLGPYFRATYAAILEFRRQAGHGEGAVSFEDFLDWLAHSGHPNVDNEHWVPQVRILSPQSVAYDFIGRFENLSGDAAILMERMGCTVPFPTRESLDFPGTNAAQRMRSCYSERAAAVARDIYAVDFEAFGYSREFPGSAR